MKAIRLDPRSKLVASLAATAVMVLFDRWWALAGTLGVFMSLTLLIGLGRPWLVLLRGLGFAAISFFVIAWISFDLSTALEAGLRLIAIGTIFFFFFQTTPPEDLSNALVKMGLPYAFTFVLTASMQFIPVLTRRASNIRDAQKARGVPLNGGLRTLRHLPALVGPLLIQAFKLADEMAEAMEARGFGAPDRRFRSEPRFRTGDWVTVGASIAILLITVWARLS